MTEQEYIAEHLRKLILDKFGSVRKYSVVTGIKYKTASRWVNGRHPVPYYAFLRLETMNIIEDKNEE